ncbi:MAG: site-specific DNA-methyltransferase [Zoogloeaceae bacterium]|jgi:site-specific DNA-methyltransferase (adenine-specific)|nr:site-specific DNA-methyltransferase [Zoogloeaceae bacterium]
MEYLEVNKIHCGDAKSLLTKIRPNSIALSVWSPPYHVGKEYEKDICFDEWKSLLSDVIRFHFSILKPGGFLAINIADILCFKDESLPKIMAENISRRKVSITKEQIIEVWSKHPDLSRKQIAEIMGCSEQTIDRRMNGNNIRGGKYSTQTRVKLAGNLIEQMAYDSSLYLYDRRIWVKDPAWENSKWHSISYRAVDEFEYVYIFWKPGITTIDRSRLTKDEWINWGSRAVWNIASVRSNNDHEAKFPFELPRRLIQLFTDKNDIVLDCFVGSGTTASAAIVEDRQYIGIDKEYKYVLLANQNCRNTNHNKKFKGSTDFIMKSVSNTLSEQKQEVFPIFETTITRR